MDPFVSLIKICTHAMTTPCIQSIVTSLSIRGIVDTNIYIDAITISEKRVHEFEGK